MGRQAVEQGMKNASPEVMGLCRDAGIADFVSEHKDWRSGRRGVRMELSQRQTERLAVSILEMR
jgi:hypothetical protein